MRAGQSQPSNPPALHPYSPVSLLYPLFDTVLDSATLSCSWLASSLASPIRTIWPRPCSHYSCHRTIERSWDLTARIPMLQPWTTTDVANSRVRKPAYGKDHVELQITEAILAAARHALK